MVRAVANRPVEQFATDAAAPDWQIEGDNEIWFAPPDDDPLVDADGNPIEPPPPPPEDGGKTERPDYARPPEEDEPAAEQLDQDWLDRAITRRDRREPREPREQPRRPRREDNEAV